MMYAPRWRSTTVGAVGKVYETINDG